MIDQIASEHEGAMKIAKVNVDDEPQLAKRPGVQAIPFVILYRDGSPAAHATGAQPKAALERTLGLAA